MNKLIYEIKYEYYKYNSGGADNGYFKDTVVFEGKDYDKALDLYKKMQLSINKKLPSDEDTKLKDNYIPYMGYFLEATLIKSFRKEVILNELGEEIDEEGNKPYVYEHTDYRDCSNCYDKHDGCSTGCDMCNNTGIRPVTPSNIQLGIDAHEWVEAQVRQLWQDYDNIYKLNMGVYGWHVHSNEVSIEAGYSCRGMSHTDNYDLPIKWLYDANRKQLIQDQYDQENKEKLIAKNKAEVLELERLKKAAADLEKKLLANQ